MVKRSANKLAKAQGGHNLKSELRHEHLKNLSLWSPGGDTPILSLSSLFGRRLAADRESSGIATDEDLVSCQMCETILQPGFNCNVKINKVSSANKKKKHTGCNKSNTICLTRNNVVYYCSLCSHLNLKRGTAKGHMNEIYPSKPKTHRSSRPKIKKGMKMKMMPEETQSNMFSTPAKSEISVLNTLKLGLPLERDKRIRKSKK